MAEPRRRASDNTDDLADVRVLIVEARFYEDIADALLAGATRAVEAAEKRKRPYDGAVALGCVIRGDTIHFEIVSQESARALMNFAVTQRFAIGNGIITVDTESQAWARARMEEADKGGDAVRACLAMVKLKRRVAGG